ncbi:MAG: hypothetical protein IT305_29310 [Chloroflexi bacterium]|nr:hypothetical protein [Chloroflexota bacterium]
MRPRRLPLVALGLLLGLLTGEVALRFATPVRADQLLPLPYHYEELARLEAGDTYIAFDRDLGWTVAPDTSRRADDVTYRSNAAGIRSDHEYTLTPSAKGVRLTAFGDSFTHCDEVANDECWSARLEEMMPGVEALNFGVPAYGPDQAFLRYQRDGRQYGGCAVLIGFMVENVNRVVNRFRPFYQPDTGVALGKPRYVLDGDGLRLLPNAARSVEDLDDPAWVEQMYGPHDFWYYPGLFAGSVFDASRFVRLARTIGYQRRFEPLRDDNDEASEIAWNYRDGAEGIEVASRVLIQFARQVEADGATPVVLIFGRKSDVIAMRHHEDRVYEPLLRRLDAAHVTTLDLTEPLYRESRKTGVERLMDKHYSARGNEVIADVLSRKLPKLTTQTCVWP